MRSTRSVAAGGRRQRKQALRPASRTSSSCCRSEGQRPGLALVLERRGGELERDRPADFARAASTALLGVARLAAGRDREPALAQQAASLRPRRARRPAPPVGRAAAAAAIPPAGPAPGGGGAQRRRAGDRLAEARPRSAIPRAGELGRRWSRSSSSGRVEASSDGGAAALAAGEQRAAHRRPFARRCRPPARRAGRRGAAAGRSPGPSRPPRRPARAPRARPRASRCSRAGCRSSPRAGSSSARRSRVAGASSGSASPRALGEVGGDPRVPARAGEDREAAAPARPRRGLRQAAGQLEQLAGVGAERRARPPRAAPRRPAGRRPGRRCGRPPARRRASELPTLSTATPIPRSAQRPAPGRGGRRRRRTRGRGRSSRRPSSSRDRLDPVARRRAPPGCRSRRRCGSRSRGREPRALTPKLPLWVISATGPGARRSTESPQSGARAARRDDPVAVRPADRQPGRASAASRSSRFQLAAPPASRRTRREITIAPPQPRSPASTITGGHAAAGIATTTASTGSGRSATRGTQGCPWTASRFGLTPQTAPSNPAAARLRRTMSP